MPLVFWVTLSLVRRVPARRSLVVWSRVPGVAAAASSAGSQGAVVRVTRAAPPGEAAGVVFFTVSEHDDAISASAGSMVTRAPVAARFSMGVPVPSSGCQAAMAPIRSAVMDA